MKTCQIQHHVNDLAPCRIHLGFLSLHHSIEVYWTVVTCLSIGQCCTYIRPTAHLSNKAQNRTVVHHFSGATAVLDQPSLYYQPQMLLPDKATLADTVSRHSVCVIHPVYGSPIIYLKASSC